MHTDENERMECAIGLPVRTFSIIVDFSRENKENACANLKYVI